MKSNYNTKIIKKLLLGATMFVFLFFVVIASTNDWSKTRSDGETISSADWNDMINNLKSWIRKDLTNNNSDVYLGTNGKVGIGTNNPIQKLHVEGNINIQNDGRIGLNGDLSGEPRSIKLRSGINDEQNAGTFTYKPSWDPKSLVIVGAGGDAKRNVRIYDSLTIGYSNPERNDISLLARDKVGIGLERPNEKLEVNGAIKIGDTSTPCNSNSKGTLKSSDSLYYCDGNRWINLLTNTSNSTPTTPTNPTNPSVNTCLNKEANEKIVGSDGKTIVCGGEYYLNENKLFLGFVPFGCSENFSQSCNINNGNFVFKKFLSASTKTPSNLSITDGLSNTDKLLSYPDADAAKYCANLIYGGYNDWYLPSVSELNKIILNLKQKNYGLPLLNGYNQDLVLRYFPISNTYPFGMDGIYPSDDNKQIRCYWTSSTNPTADVSRDIYTAIQYNTYGSVGNIPYNKEDLCGVICVRRF